jgi:hypothetical protein
MNPQSSPKELSMDKPWLKNYPKRHSPCHRSGAVPIADAAAERVVQAVTMAAVFRAGYACVNVEAAALSVNLSA